MERTDTKATEYTHPTMVTRTTTVTTKAARASRSMTVAPLVGVGVVEGDSLQGDGGGVPGAVFGVAARFVGVELCVSAFEVGGGRLGEEGAAERPGDEVVEAHPSFGLMRIVAGAFVGTVSSRPEMVNRTSAW